MSPLPERIQQYREALRAAGASACFKSWSLFEPATEADLSALTEVAGRPLPEDLIAWLSAVTQELPFSGNYSAIKAPRILSNIRGTSKIDFSPHFKKITGWKDGRFDDGRIARAYWKPQWIPLASDGCGNEYCYDLAPGPKGQSGQILAMEFQDGQGPYLSPWASVEAMLKDHLDRLERGAYTIDEEGFIEFE